jgi:hypothetical protein
MIQLILGIVAISLGLPLVVSSLWAIFFRENDNMKIENELTPQFLYKIVSPLYGFGIFIENMADAQEKGQLRPIIILLIVGLTLCVGGYWLVQM